MIQYSTYLYFLKFSILKPNHLKNYPSCYGIHCDKEKMLEIFISVSAKKCEKFLINLFGVEWKLNLVTWCIQVKRLKRSILNQQYKDFIISRYISIIRSKRLLIGVIYNQTLQYWGSPTKNKIVKSLKSEIKLRKYIYRGILIFALLLIHFLVAGF